MATTHKQEELMLESTISQIRELHRTLEIVVLDLLTEEESVVSDQVRSVSGELAMLAHALVAPLVKRGRS